MAKRWLGETPEAWGFVLPAAVIIIGLSIIPMIWSLVLSMQSADLVTPARWIGLQNYRVLPRTRTSGRRHPHPRLHGVVRPAEHRRRSGSALMLNRKIRLIGLYRTLVFVPFVISATAQGVLFSFIFDPQFGIANAVLAGSASRPRGSSLTATRPCRSWSSSASGAVSGSASWCTSRGCRTSRRS